MPRTKSTKKAESRPTLVLTDREIACVKWLTATISWIPDEWTDTVKSLTKKLEAYGTEDR